MYNLQALRYAVVLEPSTTLYHNQTLLTTELDRQLNGVMADYVQFVIIIGSNDCAPTTLNVEETDVSGTGYVPVPGSSFGGLWKDGVTQNPALPLASTQNAVYVINLDCRGQRKRFLKVQFVLPASTNGMALTVLAIMDNLKEMPSSDAKRNITASITL